MSADLAPVVAKLDSDTTGFDAGFDSATAKTTGLEKQIAELEKAISELGKGTVEAMTSLAESISQIGEHTEGARGEMAELNKEMGADVGRRAIRETIEALKSLGEGMVDAVKEMNPAAYHAWEESLAQIGDASNEVRAALGERLLPVLEEVIGWITNGIDAWNRLSDSTKDIIGDVVEVVAGFTAASAALAYFKETAELLAPIFTAALPEVLALTAALAVIAVVAAGIAIEVEEAKKFWAAYGAEISAATDAATDMAMRTATIMANTVGILTGWTELSSLFGSTKMSIAEIGNLIAENLVKPLVLALEAAGKLADSLQKGSGTGLERAAEALDNIASHFGTDLAATLNDIPAKFSSLAKRFGDDLKSAVSDLGLDQIFGGSQHKYVATDDDIAQSNAVAKMMQDLQKQLGKEQESADAKALASARKLIDERIKGEDEIEAKRIANDQESIQLAQKQIAEAQKNLGEAEKGGTFANIQAAQQAVEVAFGRAQAAAQTAMGDIQQQIDGNNLALQSAMAWADATGDQTEVEKIRKANIALEQDLLKDQTAFEYLRQQHIQAAKAQLASYQSGAGLGGLGQRAADATQFGKLASDTASATAAGGPAAGLATAGFDLLSQSTQFKQFTDSVNKIFGELADTVGAILGPLVPIIDEIGKALQPILSVLSTIFAQLGQVLANVVQTLLQPILALATPLADFLGAIAPLIGPIEQLAALIFEVTNLFDPLNLAIEVLAPVLDEVAKVITVVVNAIAGVWNGLISAIVNVLNSLKGIPVIGGDLGDLATSMQGLEINTSQAASSVQQFSQALLSAAQTAANDSQKYANLQEAIVEAKATGASQAVIDALTKEMKDAENQVYVDADNMLSQSAHDRGDASGAAYWAGQAALLQAEYSNSTTANTDATTANTAATVAMAASLTNVPAMFKAAQVVNQVLSGQWGGGSDGIIASGKGSAQATIDSKIQQVLQANAGGVTVNGNITVMAEGADVDDIFAAIQKKVQRSNFTRTGSSPRDRVSRFTLTGQG